MVDVGQVGQFQTPEDYKSGLADVLKEAKNIYEAKKELGYQTYGGPRIAGFSPEEQAAMAGIAGLVGAGQQYLAPAAGLTAGLAQQFTPSVAQQYMSPYQQAVIDVEKREAIRQAQRPMQDIGAAATQAGGFGGSRQAILEAEAQRNLQQRLGDIQTRGQQAAYETGLRAFESQKAREKSAAAGLTSLGQIAPRQQLTELTALSGIGEAQRGMQQQALDIGYQDFLKQQQYPYELLGQYQSTLYGYPYQAYSQQTYTPYQKPSSFQQLAGVLGAAGKVGSAFGFFNTGGKIAYRSKGGLSGLTKKMQTGSTVGSTPMEIEDINKKTILMKYLENMGLGQQLMDEQAKFREEQQKFAEKRMAELEKEASPISYASDVLLGIAAADPRDPFATQLAEGVEVAEQVRPDVELARYEVQKALAEGRISELEAQAALNKANIEGMTSIYELSTPTDYLSGLDVTTTLGKFAESLGIAKGNITDLVTNARSQARTIIAENPSMYDTQSKQEELIMGIMGQLAAQGKAGGAGTPAETESSDTTANSTVGVTAEDILDAE